MLLAVLPNLAVAQGRTAAAVQWAPQREILRRSVSGDSVLPLLTGRERWAGAGMMAAAMLILPFDKTLAREFERPAAHRDARVARAASTLRWLGDPGAIVLTAGTYAVGRLASRHGLADAGLHATESVLLSGAITNVLKLGIGRARPYVVGGRDPFAFRPGRAGGTYASFPSGHTTVAFAAAAGASAELRCSDFAVQHPRLAKTASVLLFGTASLVGTSRMYHDAHWGSDVVAAAAIGSVTGHALVRLQHGRRSRGRIDRFFLGASADSVTCSR